MTRITNARLAGFMFLLYIAMGITGLILFSPVGGAEGAAKLASVAQHATRVRFAIVLNQLVIVDALVLAVALHGLTRDQDPDLAMLALGFRIAEGVLGATGLVAMLGLLWLGTAPAGTAVDAAGAHALGSLLSKWDGWSPTLSAFPFAVGSALYAYLFLRARSIPAPLAWLGLAASALLVALLPMQLVGFIKGPVTGFMWMPMLVFEVALGLRLLLKGVGAPAPRRALGETP